MRRRSVSTSFFSLFSCEISALKLSIIINCYNYNYIIVILYYINDICVTISTVMHGRPQKLLQEGGGGGVISPQKNLWGEKRLPT